MLSKSVWGSMLALADPVVFVICSSKTPISFAVIVEKLCAMSTWDEFTVRVVDVAR